MQLFPNQGISASDVAEYNQQMQYELEDIRDFIVLHYHVTNRRDSALWRHVSGMEIPASLKHRIDLFGETARVFHKAGELFGENSWIQVMMGQGIAPQRYHPTADLMNDTELAGFLGDIQDQVRRTVGQLPPHGDYVANYCSAKA
jgi:tryptophan halogenase